MHSAVVSDASCLIILFEINALHLLYEAYGPVVTTPTVASEFGLELPDWVSIRHPVNIPSFPTSIDPGEASAIALAIETPGSILIIDEKTARNYAMRIGLEITGTLGVIVKAKLNGAIPSIRPFVDAVRQKRFRFSSAVESEAFRQAGEADG